MYVVYGGFTLVGFFIWWRVQRREGSDPAAGASGGVEVETAFPDVTVRLQPDDETRR
jgi:nicotinamide mononucleotide transporter